MARFSVASDAAVASAEVVGMGARFEAIESRRLRRGSERTPSVDAILRVKKGGSVVQQKNGCGDASQAGSRCTSWPSSELSKKMGDHTHTGW